MRVMERPGPSSGMGDDGPIPCKKFRSSGAEDPRQEEDERHRRGVQSMENDDAGPAGLRVIGNLGANNSEGSSIDSPVEEGPDHAPEQLAGDNAMYRELALIGRGAYGAVFRALNLNTNTDVAVKKIRIPFADEGLPVSAVREISALKQLDRFSHPNIVKLLDVCLGRFVRVPPILGKMDRGMTIWLVFEHIEQDLATYLANAPEEGISPYEKKKMARELLQGIEFLHSHRIVHRDLKPQNILVAAGCRIKIADFGLAKTYDFEMRLTTVVVTLWYRSPEVLLGLSYATPVDIWSAGCIIAELSLLRPLCPGNNEGDQLDKIFRIIGTPARPEWPHEASILHGSLPQRQARNLTCLLPNLDEFGVDLIKRMLLFDPRARITAAGALRHRYFSDTNIIA